MCPATRGAVGELRQIAAAGRRLEPIARFDVFGAAGIASVSDMSSNGIEARGELPARRTLFDTAAKVRRYRDRAEELRTIAADWINDEAQASLLKVARDYERMANSLERRPTATKARSARTN